MASWRIRTLRFVSFEGSSRRFSTGVAVSKSSERVGRARTRWADTLRGCLTRWASSTITRSQRTDARRSRNGGRRALGRETSRTGHPSESSGNDFPLRSTIDGRANFLSSSSCHCSTKPAGTTIRERLAMPRRRNSDRTRAASMVLPSPTSSARMARPCIWRSTCSAVRS